MKIEQYLNTFNKKIDLTLDRRLPKNKNILNKAMRYTVFAGGKRLRPILTIASTQLVSGKVRDALSVACAVELIHNFALIHDDLPCMDDDDYRRGKPTCHKVFGEAIAILAGDALLNHAFKLVSEDKRIPSRIAIRITTELCKAVGLDGMIGGQALEMCYRERRKKIYLSTLKQIYHYKTAALICSAVRVGAIIGRANDRELALLTKYGTNVGFAYQIMDDISEYMRGEAPPKKDEPSYLAFFSLDEARRIVEEKIDSAKENLNYFGRKSEILLKITDYIINRNH